MMTSLRRLRWQRAVSKLHHLGPRSIQELLLEIAQNHGILDDIEERLFGYADLDPRLLQALGGDRFPPVLCDIAGGRA